MRTQSHGLRYHYAFRSLKVQELKTWFFTDLLGSRLMIPTAYYQREFSRGWDKQQQSDYIQTVLAGQAPIPIVVNVMNSQARIIDGGHRIYALDMFWKNAVGMDSIGDGSTTVYYDQVHPYPPIAIPSAT